MAFMFHTYEYVNIYVDMKVGFVAYDHRRNDESATRDRARREEKGTRAKKAIPRVLLHLTGEDRLEISSREVVRVFKALSDVTRVEIIKLLGKAPSNVTDLTSRVGVSQPKVSRHLKILRDAGLLRDVRRGKWVWYELVTERGGEPASEALAAISSLFLSTGTGVNGTAHRKRSAPPHGATPRSVRAPGQGAAPPARDIARGRRSAPPQDAAAGRDAARRNSVAPRETVWTRKSVAPAQKERSPKGDIEDFLL